jgi:hypothetical protein
LLKCEYFVFVQDVNNDGEFSSVSTVVDIYDSSDFDEVLVSLDRLRRSRKFYHLSLFNESLTLRFYKFNVRRFMKENFRCMIFDHLLPWAFIFKANRENRFVIRNGKIKIFWIKI